MSYIGATERFTPLPWTPNLVAVYNYNTYRSDLTDIAQKWQIYRSDVSLGVVIFAFTVIQCLHTITLKNKLISALTYSLFFLTFDYGVVSSCLVFLVKGATISGLSDEFHKTVLWRFIKLVVQ